MSYPPQPPQQPPQPPQYQQPPYQQSPYQQQGYKPYPQAVAQPKSSPLALTGFIMALAAIILTFVHAGFGMIVNLAAFVVSIVASSQIKKAGGALTGKGMAIAGIVISCIWFGIYLLIFVLLAVFAVSVFGGLK
jgi:hypothetical protein